MLNFEVLKEIRKLISMLVYQFGCQEMGLKKRKKYRKLSQPDSLEKDIYTYINEGDKGSQGLRLWGRKSSSRIKRCARSIRQSINPKDREKFERANGRGKSHDCCVHLDTTFRSKPKYPNFENSQFFSRIYICYIRNRSIRTHQWINSP